MAVQMLWIFKCIFMNLITNYFKMAFVRMLVLFSVKFLVKTYMLHSLVRELKFESVKYRELFSPWRKIRDGVSKFVRVLVYSSNSILSKWMFDILGSIKVWDSSLWVNMKFFHLSFCWEDQNIYWFIEDLLEMLPILNLEGVWNEI